MHLCASFLLKIMQYYNMTNQIMKYKCGISRVGSVYFVLVYIFVDVTLVPLPFFLV